MADIMIRGMEMPTQCGNCPISTNTRRCTILWREFGDPSKRLKDCPLVPFPEGHGRLGDLDKLEDAFIRYYLSQERSNHLVFTPVEIKQHFADMIEDYPTIVPAEGGGEDG